MKTTSHQTLIKKAFSSLEKTFRGTIWEYALHYKLHGKAYESMPLEQNQHFWIKSARHLTGPLMALNDPEVRTVFIIGATQCLKTIAGDIWTIFVMVHAPRNMLVLFEVVDKAKLFCNVRLMEVIRKHPVLKKQIAEADRFDVNKTYIKLAGMDIKADGLNDRSLSTLSWPYVRISEAWQTGKTGMLKKAFKRADRFPDNCKILCESQAGLVGDDLHTEASAAHQVPLTWACPFCQSRQTWECEHEFGNLRQPNFVAIKPKNAPENWEAPKPGTYSGMRFPAEGTIDERARLATWECHFCGMQIADGKENRMAIMDSYQQEYRIKQADGSMKSPKAVCFILPRESMWDNTFESSVKNYLSAKDASRGGNPIPLQDWIMSDRAKFLNPKFLAREPIVSIGSYDMASLETFIKDAHSMNMTVDAQKHPDQDTVGTFWVIVRARDKFGNSRQAWRGFCRSWDEVCRVQRKFKIPNARVAIDASKWTPQIMLTAASKYEMVEGKFMGRPTKTESCWRLFFGDNARNFRHPSGKEVQLRNYSPARSVKMQVQDEQGRSRAIYVKTIRWSNIAYEMILDNIRLQMPGMPKFEVLARNLLTGADDKDGFCDNQAKETGNFTYDKQMAARYLGDEKGRQKYLDVSGAEPHYRDCELMQLVQQDIDGMLGTATAAEEI
jgi:hypothetical protein